MEIFDVIVGALLGGAASGVQSTASSMISDTYIELKKRIAARIGAQDTLDGALEDPRPSGAVRRVLETHREAIAADRDIEVLANRLLGDLRHDNLEASSPSFASSIRDAGRLLDTRILELTSEQHRIITILRFEREASISGVAGSGKTLVAAEKGIRLAAGGQRVLFLCHNPHLAKYVRTLARGTHLEVKDIGSWVAFVAGNMPVDDNWSSFHEPTDSEMDNALESLGSTRGRYDAVVVDEGQDFRPDWWALVELALPAKGSRILYVFFDSSQAILVRDERYPTAGPILDLSRNCRNAGSVYGVMRMLLPALPEGDHVLARLGGLRYAIWNPRRARTDISTIPNSDNAAFITPEVRLQTVGSLRESLTYLFSEGVQDIAILVPTSSSLTEMFDPSLRAEETWQEYVRERVRDFLRSYDNRETIRGYKLDFSEMELATDEDLQIMRKFLERVERNFTVGRRQESRIAPRVAAGVNALWRLYHQLARFRTIEFPVNSNGGGDSIPVSSVGDFKGLEADGIVLVDSLPGSSPMPRPELFVAASRARSHLVLLLRSETIAEYGLSRLR